MSHGYIFNYHGQSFDPNGKVTVNGHELTQAEIDAHNTSLANAELKAMKEHGRGVLYLRYKDGLPSNVSTWQTSEAFPVTYRKSRNNFGAERIDVWFTMAGQNWYGVNIGDNDIVRARKLKG